MQRQWKWKSKSLCFIVMVLWTFCCLFQSNLIWAETGDAVCFTDDLGREVIVDNPGRVAALIGSFADIWCLAGGKEQLVAAADDAWTREGLELPETVVHLGNIKSPDMEALLMASPDLILCSCNTPADVEISTMLENTDIVTACFSVQTFSDYLRMLKICTQITGKPERYTQYGTQLEKEIEQTLLRQNGSHPKVLCLRFTGSSCVVKGSQDYLPGEMLADLGCINIADTDRNLLETLSFERILMDDPDFIFAVFHGNDSEETRMTLEKTIFDTPLWQSLRAVQQGNYYILENALYNAKPNAQWAEAYAHLADILYP